MVEMGGMVTCGDIMAKVGKVATYIHHYENDSFFIRVCNQTTTCVVFKKFR
jgi:hypothetical protein